MELHFKRAFDTLGPSLLNGIGIVVFITLVGFTCALIVALLVAIGRLSRRKMLVRILGFMIEIVRGTPLLVQFFYIYYVVPTLINALMALLGYDTNFQLEASTCGIIGFAINYGCYMSEVIRSAILAIDSGQREAGLALGFSESQVLFHFIIPPALRNSVPVFGNYLVMLIKDTSLLAMISVQELLLRTKTFASQTFLTVEAYTILALVYLVLSIPLSQLSRIVERKLKRV
ncbi:polar amino acid transport system permease protein [Anaerocolumna jejuensis DSM 15929]|uniref:Polar amino acid transport system permease protein n=1 Tax=Anaerocolumna jejuensis DSM 15929 TaxID=1121322 RepID=A0A1M6M7I5_9FIRM|nr:amino acid ABC transporter permease [Anaerocolumna jejuensis]SHJ79320.1 polar amino acid transport system permease protein [Anaerocolumna jejuensis DSM 15929]